MSYPFNIKFTIFDENIDVSRKQKELRHSMIFEDILKNILKKAFIDDDKYKFLEKEEPSISSIDENKQLTLRFITEYVHFEFKQHQHSLHFHQLHSNSQEYFNLEELKIISEKIKKGLEEFLHYKIDEPIVYIDTSYL
jgi:hypothetical protein